MPFVVTAADADRVPPPFMMTAADDLRNADVAVAMADSAIMEPPNETTAFEALTLPLRERFGGTSRPFQISRTVDAFVMTSNDVAATIVASVAGERITASRSSAGKMDRLSSFADVVPMQSEKDAGPGLALSSEAFEARLSAANPETAVIPDREPTDNQALLLAVFQSRHGGDAGLPLSFEELSGGGFTAGPVEASNEFQHPVVPVTPPPGLVASLSDMG
ncbi:hypothetical protein NGM99_07165 [Mesorhizobium sp. RP14(2022)]|uniref:Uncharacterized protein n=1 Tax=Mesorhizobium liriopis TaxID=2953882 RepID=A0ABT1C418_9HYPH|nr:hypothetical protein [Mesorhizobium liriopis]MCO6049569.1 hypothetical protein [Mesorhizobium liriopis]